MATVQNIEIISETFIIDTDDTNYAQKSIKL
jgi:hypothetical protein